MNFGEALQATNKAQFVARLGWREATFIGRYTPGVGEFITESFLYIDTTRIATIAPSTVKGRAPWVPSQCDLNATDWRIIHIDMDYSHVAAGLAFTVEGKYVGTH